MISFDPGDVVLVRFPFTDLQGSKQRPAMIVSHEKYAALHGDYVLMPLTSQPQKESWLAMVDWKTAGLLKPTWIKPALATIHRDLVTKRLGAASSADRLAVRKAIKGIFPAEFLE